MTLMRLTTLLAIAARSPDWDHQVLHRCAWCTRVADADNTYRLVSSLPRDTAITDGMCPDCGPLMLARLADRKQLRMQVSAGSC
jgi:hypothetical protein